MRSSFIVRQTLEAALPPGVPPSFAEIRNARARGRNEIEADLVMVDGLPATVRLTRWQFGWSHQFIRMAGGALSFEDGRWTRVDEPQGDLFAPTAVGSAQ